MTETTVSMPISALIGDDIITVASDTSVSDLAVVLSESDVGAVGVGSPADLVGVVSERDIVRMIAAGADPTSVTAEEIATRELVRCVDSSSVADVAREMFEHYVRHVVVLSDGVPVGIVSARDVLGAYAEQDLTDE